MEQAVTLDDRLDEFAAWAGGGVWTNASRRSTRR